jgi:hypothetical protein
MFLAILSANLPLNLCNRLSFFEPKHTGSSLCTSESSHLGFNRERDRGGGTGYYSTTRIKLAMFCYIMTVRNVVHVLCIEAISLQFKIVDDRDILLTTSNTVV